MNFIIWMTYNLRLIKFNIKTTHTDTNCLTYTYESQNRYFWVVLCLFKSPTRKDFLFFSIKAISEKYRFVLITQNQKIYNASHLLLSSNWFTRLCSKLEFGLYFCKCKNDFVSKGSWRFVHIASIVIAKAALPKKFTQFWKQSSWILIQLHQVTKKGNNNHVDSRWNNTKSSNDSDMIWIQKISLYND